MSISLQKGQKVSLSKDAPNLTDVMVGLGWDVNRRGGSAFDLDAAAIVLRNGKFVRDKDLCYFGNKHHRNDPVYHHGDNLTGAGEGDDEVISVKLNQLDADIDKIVFVVNIYSAESRGQNFGMVQNAFIRLADERTGQEFLRYNISDGVVGDCPALIFAEMYKHNGEWKFNAIGNGIKESRIQTIAERYR